MKKQFLPLLLLLSLLLSACAFPLQLPGFPSTAAPVEEPVSGDPSDPAEIPIPPYSGQDYTELNGNRPLFTLQELSPEASVRFSELDALGRTGTGSAILGPETLPTRARGPIGDIRPSGWHTARYDDLIEDRYLYNRCHVIGFLLCGDDATPENLFTGTRWLNTVSMLPFEIQTARYIEQSGNHVAYRVTPRYTGDNLVADGVQMEAFSVEDAGRGLAFHVFVYNIQPGILIDYRTGESRRDPAFANTQEAQP